MNNTIYILGAVYFPPRSPPSAYEDFCAATEELLEQASARFYLFGDFNLPHTMWLNDDSGLHLSPRGNLVGLEKEAALLLLNSFSLLNLREFNSVRNAFGACLDLCFSNSDVVPASRAVNVLLECDVYHPAIVYQLLACSYRSNPVIELRYDFKRCDYLAINNYLSEVDWSAALRGLAVDDAVTAFYNHIYVAMGFFVPAYRIRTSCYPSWFSADLKRLIVQKKIAHALYKRTNERDDYLAFSQLRAECSSLAKVCYLNHVRATESHVPGNIKAFWNFVRSKRADGGFPQRMHLGDVSADDDLSIAELFASHFESVYTASTS